MNDEPSAVLQNNPDKENSQRFCLNYGEPTGQLVYWSTGDRGFPIMVHYAN
jgi:hypothetical protein